MLYTQTDTLQATGHTLQAISSVKYRLFQFDRIPDVAVGDWMIDPTGYTTGYKQIAFVGSQGVGYQHNYATANSTTVSIAVTFYRASPDVTAAANEQDVARRLDMLSRFVGSRLNPANGRPLDTPVYRKDNFRVFAQGDRLTVALEKIDEVLGLLKIDYETRIENHDDRLDALEPDVDTFIRPPGRTVTRTTYLNNPEVVYESTVGVIPEPWLAINLNGAIPSNAKAIIGYVEYTSLGNKTKRIVALSSQPSDNVVGSYSNNDRAVPILTMGTSVSEDSGHAPNHPNASTSGVGAQFHCMVSGGIDDGVWDGDRKVYMKVIESIDKSILAPIYGDLTSMVGQLSISVIGYQW